MNRGRRWSPLGGHGRSPVLGIVAPAVLSSAVLTSACSGNPEPAEFVPQPARAVEPPAPPPPPQAEAPGKLHGALAALNAGDYPAAYSRLAEVVELCGGAPLGQQALLLIAASELDPRNPDPRRSLAAQATSLLLGALDATSWARYFTESLYLIGHRLGAQRRGAEDTEALELGWLFQNGNGRQLPSRELAEAATLRDEDSREWAEVESMASGVAYAAVEHREAGSPYCQAVWTAASVDGEGTPPPSLRGASYPAQVAGLRRRVEELEQELERIRRIVSEQ